MLQTRSEVLKNDKWNLDTLYLSFDDWHRQFNQASSTTTPHWPSLNTFRNRLHESPLVLKKFLDQLFHVQRELVKLYTFAHLKHDEDIAENEAKKAYSMAIGALSTFKEEVAWFDPELLELTDQQIQAYLKSPELAEYQFFLEKIFRQKPHTLSADKELLLAMSSKALSTSHKTFSAITDADFTFDPILDEKGESHVLTHARYGLYLRSSDRVLRENAFKGYHKQYKKFENTFAELLSGQIESHIFNARTRGFNSALEASLFPHNINPKVYHALIDAVHDEIHVLHRYMDLRAKVLKLKPMHLYDFQVPLFPNFDMQIPYEEAENLIIDSVAPLGEDYQNALRKGLKEDRWVDRYECKNKRSGAYSSGCYDSMPYILMNYKEILRDLFTLAHEAGHSMHSYLSKKTQPYPYSSYSIFVAEVASTFNEELLLQHLLKNAKNRDEKIFLLTQKIEDIRATLFRQTQFAEFEWMIHDMAERNVPLTPTQLNEAYFKLNQFYYGPHLHLDEEIASEWARIPHFTMIFTSISTQLASAQPWHLPIKS